MKNLKFLLGILLLLGIIFFAKGFLTPTVSYKSQITVNKSAKEAWAVMSDEESLPQWINGFQRTELVSGSNNTVGAVSNVYVVEGGKEMVMKETITAIKPYEQLAMTFSMDMMDMDYEMLFEEQDGKTSITSNTTAKGNGIIYKSLISFMPSAMKKQEDENLGKLKKLIEQNTKTYLPEPVSERLENNR
jgi:uncharacterized protein YndB with AHSA1/START domain